VTSRVSPRLLALQKLGAVAPEEDALVDVAPVGVDVAAPTFRPLTAPPLRNESEGAQVVDAEMQAAEEEDSNSRLLRGLAMAGERMGAAFAGVNPEFGSINTISGGQGSANNLLARRKRAADAAAVARQARLTDPGSQESSRFRSAVKAILPGVYSDEELGSLAAADEDNVLKYGVMMQKIAAGKEAAEARKERERLAKEAKEKATQDKATQQNLDREGELRRELLGNPVVREYQTTAVGFDKMRRASSDPSAAGDLAMVFGFMKTLDPGSVVKETEFANAQNATGVPDRIRNVWNRVLTGERLSPEQRAEFLRVAASQVSAAKSRADAIMSSYASTASSIGLDPSRIVLRGLTPDIDLSSTSPATAPTASGAGAAQRPAQLADVPILPSATGKSAADVMQEGVMYRTKGKSGTWYMLIKRNGKVSKVADSAGR
jgi:hypothetical protein